MRGRFVGDAGRLGAPLPVCCRLIGPTDAGGTAPGRTRCGPFRQPSVDPSMNDRRTLLSLLACSCSSFATKSSRNRLPLTRNGLPRSFSHCGMIVCRSCSSCVDRSQRHGSSRMRDGTHSRLLLCNAFPDLLLLEKLARNTAFALGVAIWVFLGHLHDRGQYREQIDQGWSAPRARAPPG